MRPLEFHRLGLRLAQDAATESQQRIAVTCLYYGLHHEACCRFFRNNPFARPLNRNSRHRDLGDRYRHSIEPHTNYIARLLDDLTRLRAECHYQLTLPLRFRDTSYQPNQILELALEKSNQLLAALEAYSPGEAPDNCNCPQTYSTT